MGGCAADGGCPTDYLALCFSSLSLFLLLARSTLPYLIYKVPRSKGSSFWIPAIQVLASFNLLLSVVMSVNLIKIKKRHWWQSCYIWAAWFQGPLGFGLLLSCRIVQVYQLYFIFVKKRLPPVRSLIFLPSVLIPWIAAAAAVHVKKPLNYRCQLSTLWIVPVVCLHLSYVIILVALTRAIQHVEFRFQELKDLRRGIVVSALSVGIWVTAYTLNEIHENVEWLQVSSRFLLSLMTSIFILVFFSLSSSQPLLSQMSLRIRESSEIESMGKALGIPDSGVLVQREHSTGIDLNQPLDKLLSDKGFRQSFMEFADSCWAGESVHFYEEVMELGKLPVDDTVRRIYMARHIIHKYIVSGAPVEVNISYRTRQAILSTLDLAHPDLFKPAMNEIIQLMKMNLARDYWSSTFFMKYKEEENAKSNGHDHLELVTGWNVSPRLSSVHAADDPFQQENQSGSDSMDRDL